VRRAFFVLAVAAALAGCAATASEAQAPANGRFVVQFASPRNGDERFLVQLLRAAQLPQVFAELGKHLKLPRNIITESREGRTGRTTTRPRGRSSSTTPSRRSF
jgi:hypothetical protein